jgi:hypothetical protein
MDMDESDAVTPVEQVRSVIDRLFSSVERRDPEAYFDRTYDPEVRIHEADSLPYGGTYHGLVGAQKHAEGFLRTWDSLQSEPATRLRYAIHALPDEAFVTWSLTTIDPGTGVTRSLPVISHYRLRRGLIVESRMYHFDTVALLSWTAEESTSE